MSQQTDWTPQTLVVACVTSVKGRGLIIFVTLSGPEPPIGTKIMRMSDGVDLGLVAAVEWFAIERRPGRGDQVGLLLKPNPRASLIAQCNVPVLGDVVCLQADWRPGKETP